MWLDASRYLFRAEAVERFLTPFPVRLRCRIPSRRCVGARLPSGSPCFRASRLTSASVECSFRNNSPWGTLFFNNKRDDVFTAKKTPYIDAHENRFRDHDGSCYGTRSESAVGGISRLTNSED